MVTVASLGVVFLLASGMAQGAEEEHGGGGGIFAPALDLGIWTMVVFLLLLFFLSRYAWKPMLEGLQRREKSIHDALADAERARTETQSLRDQLQQEVNHANEKVRDILDEGRRAAEQTTQDMIAKTRREIQDERERLRKEIGLARDQALQELWNQTAQLATLISAKAIRRSLSAEEHRLLVNEALNELRQAGENLQKEDGRGHG
jgi:F-type H+-transporting ATPase subunit b